MIASIKTSLHFELTQQECKELEPLLSEMMNNDEFRGMTKNQRALLENLHLHVTSTARAH